MVLLQCNANVLSLWVLSWVFVISHVPRLGSEDAVIAAEFAVFTGEPRGASLAEDNVSWYHIFSYHCG